MVWLWIAGPIFVVVIWFATAWPDRRRDAQVERWRRSMGPKVVKRSKGGYRSGRDRTEQGPGAKRVRALPGPQQRLVDMAGGGVAQGHFELAKDLAYASVLAADLQNGSDFQAVTAKLEEAAPAFIAHPLPIIEGERAPNTGVEFKKDPDFMTLFLVDPIVDAAPPPKPGAKPDAAPKPQTDAERAKAIRSFLSRPVRDALRDLPDAWLFVQGKAMALVLYGAADAEKIHELVTTADVIFAEYGAGGGPSLLGEDGEADAAGAEADDDEDDADEEVEAAPPPPPKKAQPAAAAKKPAGTPPPKTSKGKADKGPAKGVSTKD
jgi:hypothetical protein